MTEIKDIVPIAVKTGWMRGPKLTPALPGTAGAPPAKPQHASPVEARLEICRKCEHFRNSPIQLCRKCGCALNLKARLARAHCPLGKW